MASPAPKNAFIGAGDGVIAPKNKFSRGGCQRNENGGTHNPGSKHDQVEDGPPTHDDGRYGIESPGSGHPPTRVDAHKNGPGLHRHRRPGEVLFLPHEDTRLAKIFYQAGIVGDYGTAPPRSVRCQRRARLPHKNIMITGEPCAQTIGDRLRQ